LAQISKETLKVATEMSLAHNLLLRQLNAIYLQCTSVTLAQDKSDFLVFSQTWWQGIHHHHSAEERYFFPWIEEYTGEKGIMEKNVEQHEAFGKGLEEFKAYVFATDASIYDGKKLRAIIDGFGNILAQHLREEISTLLELEKYGGKNLAKAWANLEEKVKLEIENPYRMIPMGLGAVDKTFEGGKHKKWPPFPWFVPYLCKFWFYGRHKGSWRFSPCTVFGIPRELPFVEVEK